MNDWHRRQLTSLVRIRLMRNVHCLMYRWAFRWMIFRQLIDVAGEVPVGRLGLIRESGRIRFSGPLAKRIDCCS